MKDVTRHSTADPARRWAMAALGCALIAVAGQSAGTLIPDQIQTALQYFAAVMQLTPLIAVLGARRPGCGAWPWFVVVPLIAVLQWPAASQLMSASLSTPVEIPAPTSIGFLFVLLMGAGNYFGTRHTGAVICGSSGVVCMLLPLTEWFSPSDLCFGVGCLLICTAVAVSCRPREFVAAPGSRGVQFLWCTFRDIYGIVWAKRVVDRVNQFSDREKWAVVLTLEGFIAGSGSFEDGTKELASPDIPDRAVEILCWVLQRFVDPEFFQQFLPEAQIPERWRTDV